MNKRFVFLLVGIALIAAAMFVLFFSVISEDSLPVAMPSTDENTELLQAQEDTANLSCDEICSQGCTDFQNTEREQCLEECAGFCQETF